MFQGQIFDAHVIISKLVESANTRIVLIDNYVDATVLAQLDKRKPGVKATIYTQEIKPVPVRIYGDIISNIPKSQSMYIMGPMTVS